MTSPQERRVKPGNADKVPRTPNDFANRWHLSPHRARLVAELDAYETLHPSSERLDAYEASRRAEKSPRQRRKSPYTISYPRQVSLTIWRGWRRLLADPGFTIASLLFNLVISLVIGSMFYDLDGGSASFYSRGGVIFFSLLFNAFASQLEVLIYSHYQMKQGTNH